MKQTVFVCFVFFLESPQRAVSMATASVIRTLLSVMGGRTIVFSIVCMTIFHNSLSSRFSTDFSQASAYSDNDPAAAEKIQ